MTGRMVPPQEVVERALGASRSDGCVVIVSDSSEADVRFACNTVTTNGVRMQRRVSVASFVPSGGGVAVGVASRSGAGDAAEIEELVEASEADARKAAPADDAAPLVEPSGEDRSFSEPPEGTGAGVLGGVVGSLAGAFERARSAGNVLAGFATHEVSSLYLGSTTGLRRRHVQPEGTLELVARSDDGTRSAWAGAGTAWFDDLDLGALEDRLVTRLGWAKRRVELPAGRYETILPPDAAADLVVMLSEALSGRDAEEGRSVFSAPGGATKLGEPLSALPFELRGDPAEPGLECAPFVIAPASSADVSVFDNGLPITPTKWVTGGRLERLQYHRAAAARSGVMPAFGIDNLTLEIPGASGGLDDLVARTERGLLLTCLWYIREVDPQTLLLTGLTRDGVYLIEKGEVTGAVNNFRFNESPVEVLGRTLEAGASERALSREWGEWLPRTAMPALRVADFNMSSVSPAT
ncbi:MAG TPA: metallopeptidase TldD-related protein [Acidimicrobiales bacterium]|nr:metallopeptidase TldD-related protein [Acidimicrobiales bacterium]